MSKNAFRRAKKTVDVSVGESVRIVRELQGLSQNQLATVTGYSAIYDLCDRERPRESRC